jgi:hypothetical protein
MKIKLYSAVCISDFIYVLTWSLILRKNTDWQRWTTGYWGAYLDQNAGSDGRLDKITL